MSILEPESQWPHPVCRDGGWQADRVPLVNERSLGLIRLCYELLDAHVDTSLLAEKLAHDPWWQAHLDYLRDLQRVGREALALESSRGYRAPIARNGLI